MRFFIYRNSILATICSIFGAFFISLAVMAMIGDELDILSGIIALAIGLGLMWLGDFISTKKAEKKRNQARQNTGAAKAPVYTQPRQSTGVTKPANKIAIAAAILFLLAAATEFWATESTRALYTNIAQSLNSENVMLIGMGVVLMAAALRTKQLQEVSVLFVVGFLGLTLGSLDVTLVNWRDYATLVYEINTLFQYTSETLFRTVAYLLMLLLAVLSLPKCKARTGVVVKWLWLLPIILLSLAYIKLFVDGRISGLLQRLFHPRWVGLKHIPREVLDALAQLMVLAAALLSSLCFRRLACSPAVVCQPQAPYVQPQPQYTAPEPPRQPEPKPVPQDQEKMLQAYRDLLENGILTQEEYQQKIHQLSRES